jgi:hypothetical protein
MHVENNSLTAFSATVCTMDVHPKCVFLTFSFGSPSWAFLVSVMTVYIGEESEDGIRSSLINQISQPKMAELQLIYKWYEIG